MKQTADGAVSTARRLVDLFQKDREGIQMTSLQEIRRRAGLSFPAASAGMSLLVDQGIAREVTGRKRNRAFGYTEYLSILSEGTESDR